MCIDAISTSEVGYGFEEGEKRALWNGREVCVGGDDVKIRPMAKAGGSVTAKGDTDGSGQIGAEIHVTTKDENGGSVSVSAGGNVGKDRDGNVYGEVKGEIQYDIEF